MIREYYLRECEKTIDRIKSVSKQKGIAIKTNLRLGMKQDYYKAMNKRLLNQYQLILKN